MRIDYFETDCNNIIYKKYIDTDDKNYIRHNEVCVEFNEPDDDQIRHDHKAKHAQWITHLFDEGQQQTRFGRQVHIKARLHPRVKQLEHAQATALRNAEHQIQGSQQTDHRLPEIFFA